MLFLGYRFSVSVTTEKLVLSKTFLGISYFQLASPLNELFIPHQYPRGATYKPAKDAIVTLQIECDEEDPWLRDSPESLIISHYNKPIEFFTANDRQTFDYLVAVLQKNSFS